MRSPSGINTTGTERELTVESLTCPDSVTAETIGLDQVLALRVGCWRAPVHVHVNPPGRGTGRRRPAPAGCEVYRRLTGASYVAETPSLDSAVA